MAPLPTIFPSLVHVMFGVGLPVALQLNFACENSIAVLSAGRVVKLGGSANIYKVNYWP